MSMHQALQMGCLKPHTQPRSFTGQCCSKCKCPVLASTAEQACSWRQQSAKGTGALSLPPPVSHPHIAATLLQGM